MTTKQQNLDRIQRCGVIAILRTERGEVLADVTEALVAGGVDCVEITFTVPRAHEVIAAAAKRLGDRVLLGAGTVLNADMAKLAVDHGARFIVAPNTSAKVIDSCRAAGVIAMPGAMTPTEVVNAWELGADIVKIFPSDSLGPGHLKALRAPLPHIRMVPTGGVNFDTVGAFLAAGAFAVGVGGCLVDAQSLKDRNLAQIEANARQFVAAIAAVRTKLK
jgi:2-dehydro-3-deoxyphosphogluconate aldolase/(4S)-4-hydroxy-2-oxoglutarate aldolase